jgi:hypothetical protein
MVLYHANGQVMKAHEGYLEQAARKKAEDPHNRYEEQIEVAKAKDPNARDARDISVYIVVGVQGEYRELYANEFSALMDNVLEGFVSSTASGRLPPEGLDRRTLMRCSSLADDHFTFEPRATELHLPVTYPRHHLNRQYYDRKDDQMAYVREEEITAYIIPWLNEMESKLDNPAIELEDLPQIGYPDLLLGKIHLYNVMLQLGIASRFQRPLVDALILQIYQTNLNECHLDTLEMTVCRFYSRGVAILDPVINHFIGTYSRRTTADRANPKPLDALRILPDVPTEDNRTDDIRYLPVGTTREWLEFRNVRPDPRLDYPDDTVSLPPRLEVLGHCIRHWSGLRRNGSTAAAHMGFPLNVGRVFKYYRRRPTSPVHSVWGSRYRNRHYADYSTHRLKKVKHFHEN